MSNPIQAAIVYSIMIMTKLTSNSTIVIVNLLLPFFLSVRLIGFTVNCSKIDQIKQTTMIIIIFLFIMLIYLSFEEAVEVLQSQDLTRLITI